jgi:hypothetical protein
VNGCGEGTLVHEGAAEFALAAEAIFSGGAQAGDGINLNAEENGLD